MQWDDLRYLLAVERAGSLASAARALRVDQSTVGRRLAALQRSFGARLLERTADGYRLTALGRRACAVGGDVERALSSLEREGREASAQIDGVVRIATAEGFIPVLMRALRELRALQPRLRFELRVSSGVLNLVNREADIALRMTRDSQGSLVSTRLVAMPWGLFASQEYISRRGVPRGLNGHDVIGYVEPLTRTVGGQWLAQHAAKATPTVLADHVGTAISAAAEGFGVAAAPCFIAAREPRVRSVRAKPIGESECFLVTHQEHLDVPRMRVTIDHITRWMRSDPSLFTDAATSA